MRHKQQCTGAAAPPVLEVFGEPVDGDHIQMIRGDALDDNATLREAALEGREDYEWASQQQSRVRRASGW